MNEVKRILHVIAGMGSGGAEKMIINWYRNIDKTKFQFDFLLRSDENMYKDEISALGGRIYIMPEYPRHFIQNHRKTDEFFKEHAKEYYAIHVHANALMYVDALKLAKKYGIPKIIMHSHNTRCERFIYRPFHIINKRNIKKYATDFLACSDVAGKWMFNGEYKIISDAINIEDFQYDENVRTKIRQEENLGDKFVIGHVGRFLKSKNHPFLIEIFEEILKRNENSVLLLIGEGKFQDEIQELVKKKGLLEKVRFLGIKSNINEYYSAFDVLLFPSFFEGLAIAAIEAQASGLKTVTSFAVPDEAHLTEYHEYLSLDDSAEVWAEKALQYMNGYERKFPYAAFCEHGYEIKANTKILESIYNS